MKIATILALAVAAIFLGACDRIPSSNGGVTVVSTPGSEPGKNGMFVVVQGKSGRERHIVWDEDGALTYKGADNIWEPPVSRQHTAEPKVFSQPREEVFAQRPRHHMTERGRGHSQRRQPVVVHGVDRSPPPCAGTLRRNEADNNWVCRVSY